MALTSFNLTDLFAASFGYAPAKVKFDPTTESRIFTGDESGTVNFAERNLVNRKSQQGMYGRYYAKDVQGRDVFMPLTLGGLFLPYVWLNVKVAKRLVETPLTERRGSAIELISFDAVQIGVKGLAIKHDGTFPEEEIEDLRKLHDRAESLACKSVLTDIFLLTKANNANDKVVMRDLEIMDNQGIEHVRGFQFSLTSDQILDLELA
jgi:hypothetical protein